MKYFFSAKENHSINLTKQQTNSLSLLFNQNTKMSCIVDGRRVFYHYPEVRYDEAKYILSILSPEDKTEWLGSQLYYRFLERYPTIAAKLTGMFLEIPEDAIVSAITHPIVLISMEKEAVETLKEHGMLPSEFYIFPLPKVNPLSPFVRAVDPCMQSHLKQPITNMVNGDIPVVMAPIYPYPYFQQPCDIISPPPPYPSIPIIQQAVATAPLIETTQPRHPKSGRRNKININSSAQADLDEVIRSANPDIKHCGFCNADDHYVRESATDPNSPVLCPLLREFNCPYCKQKGHTKKNCPSLRAQNKMYEK